jgi:outer membrane usher protein
MGQVLLSVGEDRHYRLVWGQAADQQCAFSLDLAQTREQDGLRLAEVSCASG